MLINDGSPIKIKKKQYRLIKDWEFKHQNFGASFIVPKGYQTDLASIPKWAFWWKRGKWDIAAIAHDWICDFGFIYTKGKNAYYFSRAEGDKLFLDICLAVGVPRITAYLMFAAVRLFSIYFEWRFK